MRRPAPSIENLLSKHYRGLPAWICQILSSILPASPVSLAPIFLPSNLFATRPIRSSAKIFHGKKIHRGAESGVFGFEGAGEGFLQVFEEAQFPSPLPQVCPIEPVVLNRDNSGDVAGLAVGRRDSIPEQLVQEDVFGGCQDDRRIQPSILDTPVEHGLLERIRAKQPEVNLQT